MRDDFRKNVMQAASMVDDIGFVCKYHVNKEQHELSSLEIDNLINKANKLATDMIDQHKFLSARVKREEC